MANSNGYIQLKLDFENGCLAVCEEEKKVTAKVINERFRTTSKKSIVFTYGLTGMTRKNAMEIAAKSGWCVADRITSNTAVLVVGSKKRVEKSSKQIRAERDGIKMIPEKEFLKFITTV